MKRIITLLLLKILITTATLAQYSVEFKALNFKQINETAFTFDVNLKNTGEVFAVESIQWAFTLDDFRNGGLITASHLTYLEGTTDLVGNSTIPESDNFGVNEAQDIISWSTDLPNAGAIVTFFGAGEEKRIGTFKLQLRNAENTAHLNFADVSHNMQYFAGNTLIIRCDYTLDGSDYRRDGGNSYDDVDRVNINDLSTRQLAGYWYTGSGNFSDAANWNNVTSANSNTLPGATNNAWLAGQMSIDDAREVKEMTIAEGSYLQLAELAQLTTNMIFNDNIPNGKNGAVTIAEWDFEDTGQTVLPYFADDGITANDGVAEFASNALTFQGFFDNETHSIPGWNRAAFATGWQGGMPNIARNWQIEFSSSGYENLKLSSKQWSDLTNVFGAGVGPNEFKVQWSTNGTDWTDVSGGTIIVGSDGVTGTISNLSIPNELNNQSTAYIRWLNSSGANNGYSGIDDIIITGEPLPAGILVESSPAGTGSLIHHNEGVQATMQRYIAGAADWAGEESIDGYHLLSSPVANQTITANFTAAAGEYDFYGWDEQALTWRNHAAGTFNGWNGGDQFVSGRGYLVAYKDHATREFVGALHGEDVSINLTRASADDIYHGWNLLGNPFASAITWADGWTLGNVAATAYVWDEGAKDYVSRSSGQAIPAHNGMMVYLSSGASQSLTIPAAAKTHSAGFYKSNEERIVLYAHDPARGAAKEVVIRFNSAATQGFDLQYDAVFLQGFAPRFYSVSEGIWFGVNTLPQLDPEMQIPLGFEKTASENFYIELAETITGENIYLTDLKTNTTVLLSDVGQYHFTAEDGDDLQRFKLSFGALNVIDFQTPQLRAYVYGQTLFVHDLRQTTQIELYNQMGQRVHSLQTDGLGTQQFMLDLPAGVYVVRLSNATQSASAKVIIQ